MCHGHLTNELGGNMKADTQLAIGAILLIVALVVLAIGFGLGLTWLGIWLFFKITGIAMFHKFWYIYGFLVLLQMLFGTSYVSRRN